MRGEVVSGIAFLLIACEDYGGYGQPGARADASHDGAGLGGTVGVGGGGAGGAVPEGGNGTDASADAGGEGGIPGTGGGGAFGEAGVVTTEAGSTDAMPDGLLPDAIAPVVLPIVLTFDSPAEMNAFEFITPEGFLEGPGNWTYCPCSPNPNLVQSTNVLGDDPTLRTGTMAIYTAVSAADVAVSARVQSTDSGYASLALRIQSPTRYYRFRIAEFSSEDEARIELMDGTTMTELAGSNYDGNTFSHDGGHVLKFEAVGDTLTAYVDGAPILTATDTTIPEPGPVGLETIALFDAHFDDVKIEAAYPAADAGNGADATP